MYSLKTNGESHCTNAPSVIGFSVYVGHDSATTLNETLLPNKTVAPDAGFPIKGRLMLTDEPALSAVTF